MFLLQVTRVEGKKLEPAVRLPFTTFFPTFNSDQAILAPNWAGVEKLLNQRGEASEKPMTKEDRSKFKKNYAGTEVELIVHETGYFSGIPRNLPEEVGSWQGRGFQFSTNIVVMKAIEQRAE